MPENLKKLLRDSLSKHWGGLEEIRLRVNRPLIISTSEGSFAILTNGSISPAIGSAYIVTEADIKWIFCSLCENSIYAHAEEIKQGYITIKGGHRAGFSGKAVLSDGKIENIKEINSINIRVAKERIGCGAEYIDKLLKNGKITNTLVISPPGVGKTTLLRDMARLFSNSGLRVSVIDERGEIGASYRGIPQNDIGVQTDIIEDVPKEKAIPMMLRTMSPQLIVCDEIATEEDARSVKRCFGAGVGVIASAHSGSLKEIKANPLFKDMFFVGGFEKIILLKRNNSSISKRVSGEIYEVGQ